MRPCVERYVARVLGAAALAPRDARDVRAELAAHLEELLAEHAAGADEEEALTMLTQEFGEPERLGAEIARGKGRARTWWKKQLRRAPAALAVAVGLMFLVRSQVAEAYHVVGASMDPAVPAGAWVIVEKLSAPAPGDVVIYRDDDGHAIVARADAVDGDRATVSKLGPVPEPETWPRTLGRERIVGRVWLVRR